MQLVCTSCGTTAEAAAVRVRGTQVWVVCAGCGAESPLNPPEMSAPSADSANPASAAVGPAVAESPAAPAQAAAPAPLAENLPPIKCPKCGHRQEDPEACHRCGLVFALVGEGERPWEKIPPGKEDAWAQATELWAAVEAHPQDPARHEELVEYCRTQAMPEWAAMRYRHWLADYPEDALAQTWLNRAVADAQVLAQALIRKEDDEFMPTILRLRGALVVGLVAFIVILIFAAIRIMAAPLP